MESFIVQRASIASEGNRLGARTFAGGALSFREWIKQGPWRWKVLGQVANVFRGPLHKRIYVRDVDHGIPYLTASDVPLADLPRNILLSAGLTPELPQLRVKPGWSLVSSAGTIGNVTFVRDEMADFAVSQDMLRVASNGEVLAGYLFAYLSTAGARSLLQLRTYGSVVDRIEPKHIDDLPVPLPDQPMQEHIHFLVMRAAAARTQASEFLSEAATYFDSLVAPMPSKHDHARAIALVPSSTLNLRLDAFHHVGWAAEPKSLGGIPIRELGKVTRPGIVKRIFVESGVPFVSGIDVFQMRPSFRERIMRTEAEKAGDLLQYGQILVQRSGQRYGLIGSPAFVGRRMHNWAASEHLIRITLLDRSTTGLVFAFLLSDVGRRVVLRSSYGTSIPELNPEGIAQVQVPALPPILMAASQRALQLREQADADEERAIQEVEAWLG